MTARSSRFIRTAPADMTTCPLCGAPVSRFAMVCVRCGGATSGSTAESQAERIRSHLQERIGDRFRLLDLIGYDGTETIFRAHDNTFRRDVALKVLALDLLLAPDAYARLEREVGLASQLDHPHITPVLDVGKRESIAYYTMGLADGGTVEEALNATEPMLFDEIVAILRDAAAALDYAHEQGVVHGAIKPANILIGKDRACVAGFGTAEVLGGGYGTSPGRVSSMAYLSPEQWHGGEAVDGRADQYALAVIAFELITGKRRLSAPSVQGVATLDPIAVTADVPLRPKLPLSVNAALRRALAKDPRHRFGTVSEFVDTLAGDVSAVPAGMPTEHPGEEIFQRPNPWIGLILIIVALAVVGAAVMTSADSRLGGARVAVAETLNGVLSHVGITVPTPDLTPSESPNGTRAAIATSTVSGTGERRRSTSTSPTSGTTTEEAPGAQAPAALGYVRVAVNNGSGEVLVDGEPRGGAPGTVEVSPGFHVISVRGSASGYAPGRSVVVVSANDTSAVTFTAIGGGQPR